MTLEIKPKLRYEVYAFTCFLTAMLSSVATAQNPPPGQPAIEPGLSARIGALAIAQMPGEIRTKLNVPEWQIIERLQILPLLSGNDSAKQIKLILEQVKDGTASPELLASAVRAVVALSIIPYDNTAVWLRFRENVALGATLGEAQTGPVPAIVDVESFTTKLRTDGSQLHSDVLTASASKTDKELAELRKRAASSATRGVLALWNAMLARQVSRPVGAAKVQTKEEKEESTSAEADTEDKADMVISLPVKPARSAPVLPVRYVGNKSSLKFHRLNCNVLPSTGNQVPFPTREEALRRGYKPCMRCRP